MGDVVDGDPVPPPLSSTTTLRLVLRVFVVPVSLQSPPTCVIGPEGRRPLSGQVGRDDCPAGRSTGLLQGLLQTVEVEGSEVKE